ncbi:MAG: hypothetical protein ABFD84_15665, partial [Candidatus Polarisedimenticolia bacterium]
MGRGSRAGKGTRTSRGDAAAQGRRAAPPTPVAETAQAPRAAETAQAPRGRGLAWKTIAAVALFWCASALPYVVEGFERFRLVKPNAV